ncbi:MAG: hypothetical protein ACK5SQ_06545 [Chitinophagales bacterium]|jgi:hypothetical protein
MNIVSTLLLAKWTDGSAPTEPCSYFIFYGVKWDAAQRRMATTWTPLFWFLLTTLRLLACPRVTVRQAFLGVQVQQTALQRLGTEGDQQPRVRGKPRTRYPTLFY